MSNALHLHVPIAQFLTDAERIAKALPRAYKRAPVPFFAKERATELRRLVRRVRELDLTRPRPLPSQAKIAAEVASMAAEIVTAVRFALSLRSSPTLQARFERVRGNSRLRGVPHAELWLSAGTWAMVAREHAADLAGILPIDLPDRLDAKALVLFQRRGERRSRSNAMTLHTSGRNEHVRHLERLVRETRAAAAIYLRDAPELLREFATSRRRRPHRAGSGHRPRSASSASDV